ncbi:MAG: hypothetical protein ACRDTT_00305 [Pseudonocardiaceae bacterium]
MRDLCDDGRTCPNINVTDRGTYIVQGFPVTDLDLGTHMLEPGESVVEIPSSLLPELAADEPTHGAVRRTDRGTVLVRGRLVVEVEILRELDLPAGEAAVEVPISALPELEVAHAR